MRKPSNYTDDSSCTCGYIHMFVQSKNRGAQTCSWRSTFSSNPDPTHLNQLILIFRSTEIITDRCIGVGLELMLPSCGIAILVNMSFLIELDVKSSQVIFTAGKLKTNWYHSFRVGQAVNFKHVGGDNHCCHQRYSQIYITLSSR